MMKGSFIDVGSLNFIEDLNSTSESTPIRREDLPREILISNTVESVLSQNEDLMARLKVALRRLSMLEEDLAQSKRRQIEAEQGYHSIKDQLLIWEEKEKVWQERNQNLNRDLSLLKARFPDHVATEEKLQRYVKYHEKIKTQVKPYITQLKGYARNLELEIEDLNKEIQVRDSRLAESERNLRETQNRLSNEVSNYEARLNELTRLFETQKQSYQEELSVLREALTVSERKAATVPVLLERQDELENTVISLRRSKQESSASLLQEIEALKNENSNFRSLQTELQLTIENLKESLEQTRSSLRASESKQTETQEQLTQSRFLLAMKTEELEKLNGSLKALEKINFELAQKKRRDEVIL